VKINRIAVIGECMVELSRDGDELQQGFGGDTLNTAVYLARLTQSTGISVSYFTGLGTDPYSQAMLASWQAEAIHTDSVYLSPDKLPGIYSIETSPSGERNFYYWRNDSAAKYWLRNQSLQQLTSSLSQHQLIYISGVSLAILPDDCRSRLLQILAACRSQGVSIAFDNNYRPRLWADVATAQHWYQQLLTHTDIAFLTYEDEQALWGDTTEQQVIDRTLGLGASELIIRRGGDACILANREASQQIASQPVTEVVDTTAAGDSFSAGYLATRLQGGSCADAATSGHQLAATVIQHRGAIIPKHAMPAI